MRMSAPSPRGKQRKLSRVADAVARALLRAARPEAIPYSAIARGAGVSRGWIYKYLGTDRRALLDFVASHFARDFGELGERRSYRDAADWVDGVVASNRKALRDVLRWPFVVTLYLRHRSRDDALGSKIRELEREFVRKFSAEIPRDAIADPRRRAIFAETFLAARFGIWQRWLDPAFRRRYREDEVLEMMRLWLAGCRAGEGHPPKAG